MGPRPACSWFGSRLLGDAGPLLVLAHQRGAGRAGRPAPGPDVAGERLDLLDVAVRVQAYRGQVVGGVAPAVAVRPPVVRDADLVQPTALHGQRGQPLGDQYP